MDRLTTGRRHVRAGSVHVTELINRQALRPGVPAPPAASSTMTLEDTDVTDVVGDLDGVEDTVGPAEPVSHRRPSSWGAQFAKLTSLGAATLVLCAAVATATMISHERVGASTADRPVLRITGDQALLPDQLERTLPSVGSPPPPAPMERVRPPEVSAAPAPAASRPSPATPSPSGPPSSAQPPVTTTMSDVALVRKFYDLLPRDPDTAFDLLAPNLLTSTLGEFLDSWSTVRAIEVLEVREHADGVVAQVRIALDDGGALRIEQLLTVADSPQWITGAQLLSAQRN